MRILFVTPYVPSLIRVRPFNFIKQLSRRHDVVLVALAHDERDIEAADRIGEYCEKVHLIHHSRLRSLLNCCIRLVTKMPLQAAYTLSSPARKSIFELTKDGGFDVLHVEHIRGALLADDAKDLPRVYDSVDCITRLLKLRVAQEKKFIRRMLNREELLKMRSFEPKVVSEFDSTVITSERDRKTLECLRRRFNPQEESSGIHVIPNGVDSAYFSPCKTDQVRPGSIVFSGKMSYFANVDAVLRFYREIFPRIRRARPNARFKIVGSNPPDSIQKLTRYPAIEVTGHVPDIRPHLASAEVVVCPLTVGVGIQNKVLEAMSMGKPVVATSIACNGIPDAVHGWHLIRANEAGEIGESVLRIMDSPDFGIQLGQRARQLVVDRYSWEAAAQQLEAVHAGAIDAYWSRIPIAA